MQLGLKHEIQVSITCAIILILTELYGSTYFGFLSLRNYAMLYCILILIIGGKRPNTQVFKSFKFLIYYYIYVAFLGMFNDLYIDETGNTLVFARFLPLVIIFVFFTSSLKEHKSQVLFIYMLLFVTVLDAIATILQGTGNVLGWMIKSYFSNSELSELVIDVDDSIGYSISSGIMTTVVGNGFFLSSFGLFFWVPYMENKTKISLMISLSLWFLFLVALFYNQQRMAFYSYLLLSASVPLILSRSKLKFLIISILIIVIVSVFYNNIVPNQDALGRLSQVTNEDIDKRHLLHNTYYQEFMPYHLITGDRHEFIETHIGTPHNIIIETLLLGGIGGLILFVMFVITFFYRIKGILNNKNSKNLIYALPIIAILMVSWEHSSGFHTGLTLGVYSLAIFELKMLERT